MLRPTATTKRVLGLALVLSVGTGIGVGAESLWSASRAEPAAAGRPAASEVAGAVVAEPSPPDAEVTPAAEPTPDATPAAVPAATPAAPRVSREQAVTIAAKVAPGRVVEVDEDLEESGLRYEVTLLHPRGGATEVEVDATTGRVLDTDFDDDWDRD
jgi:pyruvate/2-oxoglutarate dehydrogenase complex dihydrolipoamide acyltransferase (E2) component